MSVLMVNESADFNTLKELLGVTDGNLASHTRALENEEYIAVEKTFIGRKTNTRYRATAKGRQAFQEHLEALEKNVPTKYLSPRELTSYYFFYIYTFELQSTFKMFNDQCLMFNDQC